MKSEWTTLPLEDCMAAIIDYRGKSPEKTTFGVPLVTAKIVKGGRIEKPEEFIAEEDFEEWMRRGMPEPGDVVMTTEAPLGEVAQLDDRKVALAQRVITLRGKPDLLDNTFLKFLLQSIPVQDELRSRATGTTVLGIRQSELRKVSLTLPPLPEQKAIARILGTLDDKIELNRRMNATLEAMARALFQSWFVDFDPVRRNMEAQACLAGRQAAQNPIPDAADRWFTYAIKCQDGSVYIGQTDNLRRRWAQHVDGKGAEWTKTHPPVALVFWETHDSLEAAVAREKWLKSGSGREWLKKEIAARSSVHLPAGEAGAKAAGRLPSGMDAPTAALFPASFQNSALGEIPEGWTAVPLPEAIEVNPRRTLSKGSIAPYLDMKNLPTQGHSAEEVVDREFGSGAKFRNGDTLLARITPCLENGKTGFVDFLQDGQVGWGSTEYIVFAPKSPLPHEFGYLLARSDKLRTHAIQNMTGTSGRQRVPAECFNSFLLAVPSPEIAKRFGELVAPIFAKIKSNSNQSRTVATLRDTLLPKLLSGELSTATAP